jgi:circadian clock protein KaiB
MRRKTTRPTSATAAFERALANPDHPKYVLRLYVTGMTTNSSRAVANAKAICEQHLKGRYDLQVIDIYQQPVSMSEKQIVAVPMLIKHLPLPLRRIVGDLADTDRTLRALDLKQT